MARDRRFSPGALITDMDVLARRLRSGGWVYMRHKVQHPNWVISMRFMTVDQFLRHGWIREAVENEKNK
jgi:hypothetical protein